MKLSTILTLSVLSCMGGVIDAATPAAEELVLTKTDGTVTVYSLDKLPKVYFTGDRLTVSHNDILDEYSLEEVKNIRYQGIATGIGPVVTDPTDNGTKLQKPFTLEGKHLIFSPRQAGGKASVYSIDGRQAGSVSLATDRSVTLDLSEASAGIYLVKIGRVTYKTSIGL